jgi:small-conductance mechanosensitive channel/CRP-like cAMP-binding protein
MKQKNTRKYVHELIRAIAAPLAVLILLVLLDSWIHNANIRILLLDKAVSIGYILVSVAFAYRLICSVALDLLLAKATGRQVPKILKHLIGIFAFLLASFLSFNVTYSGAFTSLVAFSSVIAVVIGLALRPIILDVFSGLSANLDAAFHIGDWVEINGRNGGASFSGWVDEINWRTTHIKTRSGNLIICPNSTLSVSIVTNLSRPSCLSRYSIEVKLPPEIDPRRARDILLVAVQATLDVENGPSSQNAPDVLIASLEAAGVEYRIRFWLNPALSSQDVVMDLVSGSVLRHLQFAGIPLAENLILQRDKRVFLDMTDPLSRAEALGRTALFNGVQKRSLERLAGTILLHHFAQGDTIILQGAQDTDMFLLVEGAVDVLINVDEKEVSVSRMQTGDYFGEMSLLTGEPRTATIRAVTTGAAYRIDREAIAAILESDPALMGLLSRNLAERNLSRRAKADSSHDEPLVQKHASFAAVLLGKMTGIFRAA